jgi:very-short-patch-repair endonuclease
VVFSSIDPSEIRIGPNSSWGVRALKDYLEYAKKGMPNQSSEDVHEPNSEFENAVAHLLRQRGFEIVPQVGVASYRIDLAVRHPKDPGRYMLGIESDGAAYHSGRSARDRDRLRTAVLEKLGWKIHRIWSPDWFRNRKREIDKVVYRINEVLQGGQ